MTTTKTQTTLPDGRTVKIGDYVGFKFDIEQSGEVVEIQSEYGCVRIVVEATEGGYVEEAGGPIRLPLLAEDIF